MTQAFTKEKESFLPKVPLEMISENMQSDAAMAIVIEALLKCHDGVAVVRVNGPFKFWEVYAPTSCALSMHSGESASSVWGFRTGPIGQPEFGRYDFSAKQGILLRVPSASNMMQEDLARVFAQRFYTAAESAHREQQMLAALRDFCAEYVSVPERWSVNDSVVTIEHPTFTLQMDYRPVIPLGVQVLGADGAEGREPIGDLFLHFYDIKPNREDGPKTLHEAISLFVPPGFSLDI